LSRMLGKRVITALWGIPLVVAAVWFDQPVSWFTVLAALAGVLAGIEYFRITGVIKNISLVILGLAGILYFVLTDIIYEHTSHPEWIFPLLVAGAIISLICLLFIRSKENIFPRWSLMIGGVLYIGWLLYLLVDLRTYFGRDWVYLALFVTFASDTAAYFVGRAVGRHKLAPAISAGKTWEGAFAGLCAGVIISLLFTLDTPLQLPLHYWQAVLLGVFISLFGQLGDLTESLIKRNFSVKDSGGIMPGHGGLLDRLDSVLFAGAVVYTYCIFAVL
jgi:phosphatidate cytidylyltransferase